MLTITDGGSLSRALKLPIDLRLKRLLMERRDQLRGDIVDIARFISVFIISRTEAPSRPGIHTELGMASRGDPSPLGPETAMSRPDRRNRAHLLQPPKSWPQMRSLWAPPRVPVVDDRDGGQKQLERCRRTRPQQRPHADREWKSRGAEC